MNASYLDRQIRTEAEAKASVAENNARWEEAVRRNYPGRRKNEPTTFHKMLAAGMASMTPGGELYPLPHKRRRSRVRPLAVLAVLPAGGLLSEALSWWFLGEVDAAFAATCASLLAAFVFVLARQR